MMVMIGAPVIIARGRAHLALHRLHELLAPQPHHMLRERVDSARALVPSTWRPLHVGQLVIVGSLTHALGGSIAAAPTSRRLALGVGEPVAQRADARE